MELLLKSDFIKRLCDGGLIFMKILFSTCLLKVVFDDSERFAGRKLVIKGEALSWGFNAYPDSMRWLKPHEDEEIDCDTKKWIMDKMLEEKFDTGFKIIVNECERIKPDSR